MSASIEGFLDRLRAPFSRSSAVFLFTLTILVMTGLGFRGADPDLFARLAMGKLIVMTGRVPLIDPFAFSPKLPMQSSSQKNQVISVVISPSGGGVSSQALHLKHSR